MPEQNRELETVAPVQDEWQPPVVLSAEKRLALQGTSSGKELLDILDSSVTALSPVFQPVINLSTRTVFGHEALIRGPEDTPLYSAQDLLRCGHETGVERELDFAIRMRVVQEYVEQGASRHLFLNVSSSILNLKATHQTFEFLFRHFAFDPEQVVIEITEQSPISDPGAFTGAMDVYRDMGIQIALDDLGAGYNGLRLWSELRPEFVKIDRHFVDGIARDAEKQRFLETIHALANSLNSQVIAEGVEREEDLEILERFGIHFVQGYLFQHPQSEIINEFSLEWPGTGRGRPSDEEKVAKLARPLRAIAPECTVHEAADIFHKRESVEYLPVVSDGVVLGMVWRGELMDKLASRYGRDLYSRQSVARLMDRNPIVVDRSLPVENLSRTITEYQNRHQGAAFIVTENNRYRGCGDFLDLLRYMTDLRIESAQYANPLSGLPGNVPIQKRIQHWLDEAMRFSILYIDLDNFKPYNDYYSFQQGDEIIRAVSGLLQRHVPAASDFVGHIGGDDFMMLIESRAEVTYLAQSIIDEFASEILSYYRDEDVSVGGIRGTDRQGEPCLFPLMTISVGIVQVEPGQIEHQQQLSSIATRAKKAAKRAGGNCYHVIDTADYDRARASGYCSVKN